MARSTGCTRGETIPPEGESLWSGRGVKPDYVIDHETGCWNWAKAKGRRGYPGGRAHRDYYEVANGVELTSETHVHHKCENTSCVNPGHLEAIEAMTHWRMHWSLPRDVIEEIRRLGSVPGVSGRAVAEQFGIANATVYRLWRSAHWKDELSGRIEPSGWPCAGCDGTVVGKRRQARYCSKPCQLAANARNQAERMRAKRRQAVQLNTNRQED